MINTVRAALAIIALFSINANAKICYEQKVAGSSADYTFETIKVEVQDKTVILKAWLEEGGLEYSFYGNIKAEDKGSYKTFCSALKDPKGYPIRQFGSNGCIRMASHADRLSLRPHTTVYYALNPDGYDMSYTARGASLVHCPAGLDENHICQGSYQTVFMADDSEIDTYSLVEVPCD